MGAGRKSASVNTAATVLHALILKSHAVKSTFDVRHVIVEMAEICGSFTLCGDVGVRAAERFGAACSRKSLLVEASTMEHATVSMAMWRCSREFLLKDMTHVSTGLLEEDGVPAATKG